MRFIFGEIAIGWKRDLRLVLMLLVLSTIGIFCVGTACHLLSETGHQTAAYREVYKDIQFYKLSDNFLSEAPAEVENVDNTPKFRKFLNLLSESEYFDYFMMYEQPVYIENYRGKFNNVELYEYKSDIAEATKDIEDKDGIMRTSTGVKAFWIGNNVIDYFNLQIISGRQFIEDDFILKPDAPISVILGANYAENYTVGDEIYISFVFAERPAKVVGFLEEGTDIYYRYRFLNLDTYVIMPMFTNDTYDGESIYNFNVNYLYTLRNCGTVATKLSTQDIKKILDGYSEEAGFEYQHAYYVLDDDMVEKSNFDAGIDLISFLVCVIAVLTIVAVCFFAGVCVVNRTRRNRRYYAVLALNGCGRRQICSMLLLDAALIFLAAGFLAGTMLVIVFGAVVTSDTGVLRGLLLGTAFFTALPCTFIILLYYKSDLIYYLKEEMCDADSEQRNETV